MKKYIAFFIVLFFAIQLSSCFYVVKAPGYGTKIFPRNLLVSPYGNPKHGDSFANLISEKIYNNKVSAYYCRVSNITDSTTIYQYWHIALHHGTFNFLVANKNKKEILQNDLTKEKVKEYINKSIIITKKKKKKFLKRLGECEKASDCLSDSF